MKKSLLKCCWVAGAALLIPGLQAEVKIEQAPDQSVRVVAESYQAGFDSAGNWTSLVIAGTEMLGQGMKFPGKQAPTNVNVRTDLLAIRNDKVIVEFAFEPKGFELSVMGANGQLGLSDKISALVSGKLGVKPPDSKNVPDVQKVIAGESAFEMAPGLIFRGGALLVSAPPKSDSKEVKVRFECGVSASTVNLIELSAFRPVAPQSKTVAQIPGGQPVKLEATLRNLSSEPVQAVLAYSLSTGFVGGTSSEPVALPASELAAGETRKIEFPVQISSPGIHWVNLELRNGNAVAQRERTALVYDADNYRPALTRPADFSEFWKTRLEALRKMPLDPQVKEIPERSTEAATHNAVTIQGPNGKPLTFELQVPRKPGKYPALFGGKMPEKAENAGQIQLVFPHKQWPEEATYNRWVSAEDNNHLDCYLLAVRLTDYLRSREDVERIFLYGASRQGPIQLVNAALDPTKICAVDAHVPTSMGLSWEAPGYRGWGKTPSPSSMAAYVDPVNFAPDLKVPVILDEGVYDGLSPAPGALAFYNHAENTPWKRLSIEPGGHGYFTSGFRQAARTELEKFLGFSLEGRVDDSILREH